MSERRKSILLQTTEEIKSGGRDLYSQGLQDGESLGFDRGMRAASPVGFRSGFRYGLGEQMTALGVRFGDHMGKVLHQGFSPIRPQQESQEEQLEEQTQKQPRRQKRRRGKKLSSLLAAAAGGVTTHVVREATNRLNKKQLPDSNPDRPEPVIIEGKFKNK